MSTSILVTGASGFISSHTVAHLLAKDYHVTGTVRDPSNREKTAALRAIPGADERLTLVAADLLGDDPFSAHADVDAILHMASPYVINVEDAQRDLVDPAVKGTIAALRAAAANPRVRRVVLTSSMAAVTDEPPSHVLTEADWNDKSSLARNPYYYSKTLAERAAWDFMEREKPGFDLVVLNPFLVIGPAMTADLNTSNQTFADILKGVYPAILALDWGVVDVRDVADAHVAALEKKEAAGRHLIVSGNLTMAEAVRVMRQAGYRGKLPSLRLDNAFGTALMKLASHTQPAGVGSYLRSHLGRHPRFDNTKSIRALGITYRSPDEALRDALEDMAKWGHVPAAA